MSERSPIPTTKTKVNTKPQINAAHHTEGYKSYKSAQLEIDKTASIGNGGTIYSGEGL